MKKTDGVRIALLTPYTGANLGDAAIQDAMIRNLRQRNPEIQFSGISLNSENFLTRHGSCAFPLCESSNGLYGMVREGAGGSAKAGAQDSRFGNWKKMVKRIPGARSCLKIGRELRHIIRGYQFLLAHDLLVVSGGGQLDEEWGGAWGHPFALFKWTMLAQCAKVPVAFASVGAGKTSSTATRFFLSRALRRAQYRSVRDSNSRSISAMVTPQAIDDPVVPDIALSLPAGLENATENAIKTRAAGRKIIAVSPISFAKPGIWPHADANLYGRYLNELAGALALLLESGYFLVLVWSARSDRDTITELLDRLPEGARVKALQQVYAPPIADWKDLLAAFSSADFVVSSRLHSTILSFVALKPTLAISFDLKVDWLMQDFRQMEFRLALDEFKAGDVVAGVRGLESQKDAIISELRGYLSSNGQAFSRQYDTLADLAMKHARERH